jgi:hypothetical protein
MQKFAQLYEVEGEQVLVILEEDSNKKTIVTITTFIDGIRCTVFPVATVGLCGEEIKFEAVRFFNALNQVGIERIREQMVSEFARLTKEGKVNGSYVWN